MNSTRLIGIGLTCFAAFAGQASANPISNLGGAPKPAAVQARVNLTTPSTGTKYTSINGVAYTPQFGRILMRESREQDARAARETLKNKLYVAARNGGDPVARAAYINFLRNDPTTIRLTAGALTTMTDDQVAKVAHIP